jgi:transcription initiation factor TFIIIB Brf1 subunit/transcription initiation factor TFIIB
MDCRECSSENIIAGDYEIVCGDCGLVQENNIEYQTDPIYINEEKKLHYNKNEKFTKLSMWYTTTNKERLDKKLKNDVKVICDKLDIPEVFFDNILKLAMNVLNIVTKYDNTKRTRIKTCIIVICIKYILKSNNKLISSFDLISKLNIPVNFLTRTKSLLLDLVCSNKLALDKHILLDYFTPIDTLHKLVQYNNLKIPEHILTQTETLLCLCEQRGLFSNSKPTTIAASCLYYVSYINNIKFDLSSFSKLTKVSANMIKQQFIILGKTVNVN